MIRNDSNVMKWFELMLVGTTLTRTWPVWCPSGCRWPTCCSDRDVQGASDREYPSISTPLTSSATSWAANRRPRSPWCRWSAVSCAASPSRSSPVKPPPLFSVHRQLINYYVYHLFFYWLISILVVF